MHEQIALLDEAPNTDVGLLSLASYASATHPAYEAFETRPSYETAIALSHAIVNAAFDAASSDTRVLISCSWGKDSSAVVGIITEVLLARRSSGLVNPAILLMVADTGSEFIDMTNRVVTENASLEKWAAREGIALKTQVVSPAPKNTLLSELIGSGRTLPSYQQSNRATINSWCVSRLKIGPMQRALELAKADGAKLIHFLGVRMEESERRNASITRYSLGMPFGLTRVSDGKGDSNGELDPNRIGCQPIVHWTHEILTQYLRRSMPAWDPFSFESLKVIYRKGAAPEDINGAAECRIAFTKDGGVSNVCSDLGGARFGCLNCVMSANRSLANYAKNDASYRWVKAVHGFIRNGMKQHKTRMDDSAAHGFTIETLFPKNQTFEWRYKLAMFVYRSQIESGHIQLTPQMEAAINHWWERSGIHTVTMDDARADAVAWKATGKLRM
ncbi:MAG: phosphoadenosine phosphosulfate reductase family protein, partial [Opitutaceae bacterium]|nr:phosphoadenosine phosphosulfate reductase family protein [Opitutaceae bacterium]